MLLAVANQPIDTNTTFTTGGDVSRFQRRTVPAKPTQMADAMAAMGKGLGQAIAGAAGMGAPHSSAAAGVRVVRGNDDSTGAR